MIKSNWPYRRLFEILPGLLTWILILLPFALALISPVAFTIYMIIYVTYWLVKTFFMSYRLVWGFLSYRRDRKVNWFAKLEELPKEADWQKYYHLIMVPTYKEGLEILESSILSVINSNYPKDKIIYVLAIEERDKERALEYSRQIEKKYGSKVGHFETIMHPMNIPGEVVGKGGNITYAGRQILKYIEAKKIAPENVIVTSMDVDHLLDKNYLADLTYKFATDLDPLHKSFQPLPMFFNNIWDVPMINRLVAMGSSFWQLIVNTRPSRLRNFSAHAQSLQALIQTDFWSVETIVEDGHQYWRSYYRFNGCYEVVPLYTPIYQDAVLADDFISTMKEQYLQKRRWSWGVSDIPYVMEHTFKDKKIPFFDRWANALILWEAHLSWATTSVILATSAWIPIVFNHQFQTNILAYSFRGLYINLLIVAWLGMIITLIISTLLVPRRRGRTPVLRIMLDWIMTPFIMPISNIFFSSVPALESQTRLMIGKKLDVFRVTVKSIKRSNAMEGNEGNF